MWCPFWLSESAPQLLLLPKTLSLQSWNVASALSAIQWQHYKFLGSHQPSALLLQWLVVPASLNREGGREGGMREKRKRPACFACVLVPSISAVICRLASSVFFLHTSSSSSIVMFWFEGHIKSYAVQFVWKSWSIFACIVNNPLQSHFCLGIHFCALQHKHTAEAGHGIFYFSSVCHWLSGSLSESSNPCFCPHWTPGWQVQVG